MFRDGSFIRYLEDVINRVNVRFSTPLYSRGAPEYCKGGLRHHGEWITYLTLINSNINSKFSKIFFRTKLGQSFIQALTHRIAALQANHIYRILLALHINKIFIKSLEEQLVNKLKDSIHELEIHQLNKLPKLIKGDYQNINSTIMETIKLKQRKV